MGLFDKIREPIFLKETSAAPAQLEALEDLMKFASPEMAKRLEKEIRNVRAGISGENQIAFELKNSHMPMYVLHDLYLEYEGLSAQIDYLVITRRRNFVIECKNLYGNVEITEHGDFIRNINYKNKFFKERIYSPITQNERHMSLIKQIRLGQRNNIVSRNFFEKCFPRNYRSVVVLANPKTILNAKNAPREIVEQVIPADRLIAHLQKINAERDAEDCFEKDMTDLANFFFRLNQPHPDYIEWYRSSLKIEDSPSDEVLDTPAIEVAPAPAPTAEPAEAQIFCPNCGSPMIRRVAKKGDNAGNEFYGCTQYPRCRGIINIR